MSTLLVETFSTWSGDLDVKARPLLMGWMR